MNYRQLLTIAREAGVLFLEGFHGNKAVEFKGTCDLVTRYDKEIEILLKARLHEAFPEHTVVGEESTEQLRFPEQAIYVDPIDGTTNFVHGIPFCAISIGIWEAGRPVAGIVYNPVMNELYYAEAGQGATLNDRAIHVSTTQELANALIATGFPYTKTEQGEDFEWVLRTMRKILPHTRDIRRLGSASLDLCLVARGVFDGYYELGLKPWDVAAGLLILQEAGGCFSDAWAQDYQLGAKTLVAGNGAVHTAMIGYTRD